MTASDSAGGIGSLRPGSERQFLISNSWSSCYFTLSLNALHTLGASPNS